jgi:hypothetical protein
MEFALAFSNAQLEPFGTLHLNPAFAQAAHNTYLMELALTVSNTLTGMAPAASAILAFTK